MMRLIALLAIAIPVSATAQMRQVGAPSGTGPYPAVSEARADAPGYTVFRPVTPPRARMPVVLWGNGGCRNNGLSAARFLREIASHGYIVIANGAPKEEPPVAARLPLPAATAPAGPPTRTADETSVTQLLGGIDYAAQANARRSDPLYRRIDLSRVAVMGHSCGGLQALAAGADPRVDAVVAFASGVYERPGTGRSGVNIRKSDLRSLHTPVAYILGGPEDVAFPNGMDDFNRIQHLPVVVASLPVGHGGTFALANGGDWARVGAKWLDWQLKADKRAGRWFTGPDCILCTTYGWTVQRKQFPERP
ncbi:hypothetical protein G7077_01610 [Sphingomonas piscis]|uniref:PET hydrolase/cutinase-like domain-containing protein n=1 Tax=Sphingomonas piscis TaxID=2714943 RepID=A0A6G7YM33_9SPHN|nr:hypothetical protein [Sphingomonas piscis]QIK77804.1 hypothetical protein G7077_01610 [Sphingomonas piscis]